MTLRRAIRRLRLKDGDTVLIHRSLSHLVYQGQLRGPVNAQIVLIENKHDVSRLPFEELERLYLEAKKVKNG